MIHFGIDDGLVMMLENGLLDVGTVYGLSWSLSQIGIYVITLDIDQYLYMTDFVGL